MNRFLVSFALASLLAFGASLRAQDVSYKVIEEGARFPKLQIGAIVGHADMMFDLPDDITAGPAAYARVHLGRRIGFQGRYYLPLYQSGRNTFEAGGYLAFVSKELESKDRVNLRASGGRVTYINVPITRIKQNRLRYGISTVSTDQLGSITLDGGAMVPETPYRTRTQMFYVGLGRFFGSFVHIDAGDYGKKKGGMNYSLFVDVLIQGATLDAQADYQGASYDITRVGAYSPLGARVGISAQSLGGLFPFDMYVTYGWRPGFVEQTNAALEFGVGIPIFSIQ
ncbi:MAG: hypothetical protein D6722_07825 [Bacteroidetes bacterium]|nr:MAG: hypothetical protein D6722_07825 [Bacteroidota bacterium]